MTDFTTVRVTCDRCKSQINGLEIPGHATAGFYRTGAGSMWSKYADEGEDVLCDSCMQADPRYEADYPRPKDGD